MMKVTGIVMVRPTWTMTGDRYTKVFEKKKLQTTEQRIASATISKDASQFGNSKA